MMKAVFLVVFAILLVKINAQCTGSCCVPDISVHCVGVGDKCDNTDGKNFYICDKSYASSAGADCVCTAYKTLNQACSGSPANNDCQDFDTQYDISCVSGTCKYAAGAVAPGETCPATQSDYTSSQPCIVAARNCSSNCGTVAAATGDCDESQNFCPHGSFCSGAITAQNRTCAARVGSGGSCGTNSVFVSLECDWDLVCSGGKCITPFSVASGGSCTYITDCQVGLLCAGGSCTQPNNGQACVVTNQGSDCPTAHQCVCKGTSGDDGKCEATTFDSDLAGRIKNVLSCMKGSTCVTDAPWGNLLPNFQHSLYVAAFTPDACFNKQCQSQTKAIVDYYTPRCGGSAAGLTIAVALVFVLALLALMF